MKEKILLVGVGRMGQEYGPVLRDLGIPVVAVGRGESSSARFREKTGLEAVKGGVEAWLNNNKEIPSTAIIAVKVIDLYPICKMLLLAGVKRILLEKPGALHTEEIDDLRNISNKMGARVFIAYNRRYLESVRKAAEILSEDGGVISFQFEFTEWSDKVEVFDTDTEEKARWFLSNSSHIADLAFFVGGKPSEMTSYAKGKLKWHEGASVFSGSGETEKGALFSYSANWNAPGRWGVEFLSENYRFILKPLEQLQVQRKGSLTIEPVELENNLDKKYKPGVFKMVESFLSEQHENLCTLEEQAALFEHYCRIASYS